jgi:uncharacterized protein
MRLVNLSRRQTLVENLEVADTEWRRLKGLLGRTFLPADRGLLITRCNNIHTFFMKFPIDLVFLDNAMAVVRTMHALPPWRIVLPVRRAKSVVELQAGFLQNHPVSVGESLRMEA